MIFKDNALIEVIQITLMLMMSVLMVGTWFDAIFPKEKHLQTVECSVTIVDMANKFHVTLLDECEIE